MRSVITAHGQKDADRGTEMEARQNSTRVLELDHINQADAAVVPQSSVIVNLENVEVWVSDRLMLRDMRAHHFPCAPLVLISIYDSLQPTDQ